MQKMGSKEQSDHQAALNNQSLGERSTLFMHYNAYTDIVKGKAQKPPADALENLCKMLFIHQLFRLSSFNLELTVFFQYSVAQLAQDGFYKTTQSGVIQCFSCGLQHDIQKDKRSPFGHHRGNAHCQHLQGKDERNIPLQIYGRTQENIEELRNGGTTTSLGHNHHSLNNHRFNTNETQMRHSADTPTTRSTRDQQHHHQTQSRLNDPESMVQPRNDSRHERNQRTRNLNRKVAIRNYNYELCRYQSFTNWPSNASAVPEDLANAGFYYMGTDDRVQCIFCRGILRCWEPEDRPLAEHLRHFPQCPFLTDPQSTGNIPLGEEDESLFTTIQMRHVQNSSSEGTTLEGVMSSTPRHPDKAHISVRLGTYADFPSNALQKPDVLAQAGFFYTGYVDKVCCFFCNVLISNWQASDNPWYTHVLKSENCGYIHMSKGPQFLQEAKEDVNKPNKKKYRRKTRNNAKHRVSEEALENAMSSSLVKSISEEYDVALIRKVIKRRLQELGEDFPNAEAMMDAILEYEETAEETLSEGEDAFDTVNHNGMDKASDNADLQTTGNRFSETNKADDTDDETLDEASLLKQREELLDESRCKVCLDEKSCIVFLKCGHLVCCSTCAPALTKCPICRERILGTIRVDLQDS